MSISRSLTLDTFESALAAVDRKHSVIQIVRRDRNRVFAFDDRKIRVHGVVRIAAIGKAAAAMARGATQALGDLIVDGLVVSDHEEWLPGIFD